MSKFLQAADTIKKLAKQQEHLVTAAAILEEIGSLEQACDERKAALAEADKNLLAARDDVENERRLAAGVKYAAADAAATAKANADIAASETQARLDAMVEEAQTEAKSIVDAAKANGDKIVSDAQAAADALQADAVTARLAIATLLNESEAKQAELARLDDAIAKARGKVSAIMEA